MTQTTTEWSDWRNWDPTSARHPPPECTPGTVIDAELVIRINSMIRYPDRPLTMRHQFTMLNGEAFCMNPAVIPPDGVRSTHLVVRYRIQVEVIHDEQSSEMELEDA